jgi:hypothetical protein
MKHAWASANAAHERDVNVKARQVPMVAGRVEKTNRGIADFRLPIADLAE